MTEVLDILYLILTETFPNHKLDNTLDSYNNHIKDPKLISHKVNEMLCNSNVLQINNKHPETTMTSEIYYSHDI